MRFKIAIAIIIVGALITYFALSQRDRFSTVDDQDISFAFDHPDDVTKIYITQKSSEYPVTLEKKGDFWMVNGKYKAWQKKIDYLLYSTLPKIKVKGPAPKAARANIISKMAVTGIKVEIYTDNSEKPEMDYYVGQATSNMLGTYFWKEGAKMPYVVYIPGLDGYLTPAYIYNEKDWISRTIFSEQRDQIRRITMKYPGKKKDGFEITQRDSVIEISTDASNPTDVNITALRSFINHFELLNYEGFGSVYEDSIILASMANEPFVMLELENTMGEIVSLKCYYLPTYDKMHGLYDKDGNMLKYDPNRFLAIASNIDKPVVIQDYTFRKVFVSYKDFLLRNAAEVETRQQ